MIKHLVTITVLASAILQVGCTSFKYQSAHSSAPELPESFDQKFRINKLSYIYDPRAEFISAFAKEAEQNISRDNLEDALISAYPDLFSNTRSATPFDVTVKVSESTQDWKEGWYFLSLSILPAKSTTTDDIQIVITQNEEELTGRIQLYDHSRITVLSPFAWSGNIEPEVGYNGAHESQSTMFESLANPRIADIRKRIFLTELTEEINSVICRMAN
jgi:RNase P/RNase MRP subunit POP5